MAARKTSGNLALTVILAKRLCPCVERTAARGTGTLAPGAASLAIRATADGRYMLRLTCSTCGAAVEEEWCSALYLTMIGPPPGPSLFPISPTQQPGKA